MEELSMSLSPHQLAVIFWQANSAPVNWTKINPGICSNSSQNETRRVSSKEVAGQSPFGNNQKNYEAREALHK
jgi:hypothetical protein